MDEEVLLCRKRSGMCEGYSITSEKQPISNSNVLKLACTFGLKAPEVFAYNHGYRNHSFGISSDGKRYNLMLLKNELNALERVQNADAVAEIAAAFPLPTRVLADQRTLQASASAPGNHSFRLARLYHWLPGNTIPWEAYTRKHLRELGKTLSKLHHSLSRSNLPLHDALDELKDQNAQMQAYFEQKGVKSALGRKLGLKTCQNHERIRAFLASEELRNLPRQPLHLDFVRGNILWQAESTPVISGIIDFEKTALGTPLIDLARTYAFLLVDCPKTKVEVDRYFLKSYARFCDTVSLVSQNNRALAPLSAPRAVHPAMLATEPVLTKLTVFFLIFDFYKFLSHNPYDDLEKNYHFCRTRDILKERKVLEEI